MGAAKRFTTGGQSGAPDPDIGPAFGLQGHVALLPMVRVGLYAEQDTSPTSDAGRRTFWAGGLHFRITPPLLRSPWRTWAFAGAGATYAYSTGAHAAGDFMQIPLGLGLGHKLTPHSLLFAELGATFGLLFAGGMYDRARAAAEASPFMGRDSFALGITMGLSLDE